MGSGGLDEAGVSLAERCVAGSTGDVSWNLLCTLLQFSHSG